MMPWLLAYVAIATLLLCAAMGWSDPSMAKKYVRPGAKHALEMAARIQARPVRVVGRMLPMAHVGVDVRYDIATNRKQSTLK